MLSKIFGRKRRNGSKNKRNHRDKMKRLARVEQLEPRQMLAANLVANGDFSSSDISDWETWGGDAINRASSNGGELRVVASSGSNLWSRAVVNQQITLESSTEYTLSFDASASSSRSVRVRIDAGSGTPWVNETFTVGSGSFSKSFTTGSNVANPRIILFYGGSSTNFKIDNVDVSTPDGGDGGGGAQQIANGNFNSNSTAGWQAWGGDSIQRVNAPSPSGPNFSGGALRVAAQNGGQWWSKALVYNNLGLSNDSCYEFDFDSVGQWNRNLRVRVQNASTGALYLNETISVGTGGLSSGFVVDTDGNAANNNVRLIFYYGDSGADFSLDNVSMTKDGDLGVNEPGGLVSNATFGADLSGWVQWNGGGLNASHSRDGAKSASGVSGGSLNVDFNGAAGSNWWNAAAATSVNLSSNKSYKLDFGGVANSNRPIHVQVKKGNTTVHDQDIQLTAAGGTQSLTFNSGSVSGATNVIFFYGNSNVDFWLDNVSLEETGGPPSGGCPGELSDDNCMIRVADPSSISSSSVGTPSLSSEQDTSSEGRDDAGFRTNCLVSHYSYADPLRYQPEGGSPSHAPDGAHLHMFFGNTSTDGSTDNDSLMDSASSTCGDLGRFNRSAYWTPALFNGDGDVVHPRQITVYYKTLNNGANWGDTYNDVIPPILRNNSIVGIPNDLAMVSNNSNASKAVVSRSGNELLMRVEFLNCISGDASAPLLAGMDNSNGPTSHSNYLMDKNWRGPNNNCPTGFDRIPGVEFQIAWDVSHSGLENNDWSFSDGTTAPASRVGSNVNFSANEYDQSTIGLHADYMAAWADEDQDRLANSYPNLNGMTPMEGIVWCNQTVKDCRPGGESAFLPTIDATSNFDGGQLRATNNDYTRPLDPISGLDKTLGGSHGGHGG